MSVFMLAYDVHYSAVVETVDQCAAPINDTDPIYRNINEPSITKQLD